MNNGFRRCFDRIQCTRTNSKRAVGSYQKYNIREIEDYDSFHSVNEFYVQGASIWLNKATRIGLKLRFETEKELGKTDTALWYNGIQYH